jgi:predicted dehydrogenase
MARPERTLRGITVGTGYFAPIQLEAWRSVRGAAIVGLVGERDDARLRDVAREAGVQRWGTSLTELVSELRPDFIDVCVSTAVHGLFVRAANDLGLPVLCQKPIAESWPESVELVEYCERGGSLLVVNENWRWQPWYREIARIIESEELGTPHHAILSMRPGDGWGPEPYREQPHFANMQRFLLLETGIHYFDTARLLFGEIERIFCITRRVNPVIAGEDLAIAVLECAGGISVVYDADRAAFAEPVRSLTYGTVQIECSGGSIALASDGTINLRPRGAPARERPYSVNPGWKGGAAIAAQQHFVEVVNRKAAPETDGRSYLTSMAAVEAAYRSAAEGRAVKLEEILSPPRFDQKGHA